MGGGGCVGGGLMLLLSWGLKVRGKCRSGDGILVSEVDGVDRVGGGVVGICIWICRRLQSVGALNGGEGRCQGVSGIIG